MSSGSAVARALRRGADLADRLDGLDGVYLTLAGATVVASVPRPTVALLAEVLAAFDDVGALSTERTSGVLATRVATRVAVDLSAGEGVIAEAVVYVYDDDTPTLAAALARLERPEGPQTALT